MGYRRRRKARLTLRLRTLRAADLYNERLNLLSNLLDCTLRLRTLRAANLCNERLNLGVGERLGVTTGVFRPQPRSQALSAMPPLFQRQREADKREPGNEVVQTVKNLDCTPKGGQSGCRSSFI